MITWINSGPFLSFKVLTRDSVTVSVDAVVYYRVSNATVSVANVENAHHSTRLLAQTTLRNILGTKNLHEILSDRESISGSMQVSEPQLAIGMPFITLRTIWVEEAKEENLLFKPKHTWEQSLLIYVQQHLEDGLFCRKYSYIYVHWATVTRPSQDGFWVNVVGGGLVLLDK